MTQKKPVQSPEVTTLLSCKDFSGFTCNKTAGAMENEGLWRGLAAMQ